MTREAIVSAMRAALEAASSKDDAKDRIKAALTSELILGPLVSFAFDGQLRAAQVHHYDLGNIESGDVVVHSELV